MALKVETSIYRLRLEAGPGNTGWLRAPAAPDTGDHIFYGFPGNDRTVGLVQTIASKGPEISNKMYYVSVGADPDGDEKVVISSNMTYAHEQPWAVHLGWSEDSASVSDKLRGFEMVDFDQEVSLLGLAAAHGERIAEMRTVQHLVVDELRVAYRALIHNAPRW